MDGVLIVNKEKGVTSRDVVNKICKILNTKKVGHTGTLDPIATGVLVVCVGKATKLVEILTSEDKEYIATVKLGVLTDTLDTDGNFKFINGYLVGQPVNKISNITDSGSDGVTYYRTVGTHFYDINIEKSIERNGYFMYVLKDVSINTIIEAIEKVEKIENIFIAKIK